VRQQQGRGGRRGKNVRIKGGEVKTEGLAINLWLLWFRNRVYVGGFWEIRNARSRMGETGQQKNEEAKN